MCCVVCTPCTRVSEIPFYTVLYCAFPQNRFLDNCFFVFFSSKNTYAKPI